jgi:hypothetical protein
MLPILQGSLYSTWFILIPNLLKSVVAGGNKHVPRTYTSNRGEGILLKLLIKKSLYNHTLCGAGSPNKAQQLEVLKLKVIS